ncbi:MAG: CusA/CzcA family heavy metal efflux RND transporter, partial [Chitinophagaceae bacterium]|nr:CusA/CzcA family heavy metal efflux RND transporter [Chitinophagaceae bacterium]
YDQLADEFSEKLEAIPGVFFEKSQPIQMRFNELMTGIRQDVAVKIFGENMDTLATYANKVSNAIQSVQGATAPMVERVSGLPQINIEYDRLRLANYGLTVEDVNDIVSTAFAGKSTGVVFENERKFDLVVRLDSTYRSSIDDVNNLMIPTNTGNQIPLSQVANINFKVGPAQISREAGKRRIVVGFNVKGRDVQSVVAEIQQKLGTQVKLPSGYYFTYGGTFENLQKASQRLMIAVPISLLLIFLLLYFTFSSFKQASLIFTAIPMSAIGGVFALLLRGMPFSISAGIGFIALFGVAVLNGIVLIGTFNQLEKEGIADVIKRVIEGTKIRLRPVLMTATVASLGFLPMALSSSAGAEVQKPLATVVIGGLITATFLTLFVLPLLYIIFNTKISFKRKPKMKTITTATTILLLMFAINTNAQTVKQITIDEAINIAIQNNQSVKASSIDIQATESLRKTANELPKLDFNTQLGQYNSIKFDNAFQLSQTIPFPTLFGAKKELINAEVKAKQIQQQLTIYEIKNQVRSLFYQIEYLQFNKLKLQSLDSLYNEFIRVANLRYKTGDTKKIEISTAETKKGEINLLAQQNQVYLQNAYQSLKALLNSKDSIAVAINTSYSPLAVNTLIDSNAIAKHPLLQSIYQNMQIAEQTKNVVKAQGLPDFKIGYSNQSLIGIQNIDGVDKYFGAGNRFNVVNIGVAIPLTFGATKARIKSLEYQKQSLQTQAEYQNTLFNTNLQNALTQYQQDVQQYNYYKIQALPNADNIVKAAQLGYRTGDITYVEYLYALQTATDIQLKYLQSIQQINQTVVNINSIINK